MIENLTENRIIELAITSYGSEGQGVGRFNGLVVFVKNALVGEYVRAQITKLSSRFAEAKLVDVIEQSADRIQPHCKNYVRCGGCDLMHMSYAHQLEFKRMKVENVFRRIGGFDAIDVKSCIASQKKEKYRNKAVFCFSNIAGRVVAGTLKEKSHQIVETKECFLHSEIALKALDTVTFWANEFGIPAFDEKNGKGIIRHLMLRTTSIGETMVVLVATKRFPYERELVSRVISALPGLKSLILNLNHERTKLIFGKESTTLWGEDRINESILGLHYSVAAQSFLQINHEQTENLYNFAIDLLQIDENDNCADIYCGIGSISLLMAKKAKSVVGIESVPQAIEDAKNNAKFNAISNSDFICGAAEKVLPNLVKQGMRISKFMLDPPRAGVMKPVLDAVLKCDPREIVYVSCNPATLARDCKILCNSGTYMIKTVQPFDMFPQTEHVETVCLLTHN